MYIYYMKTRVGDRDLYNRLVYFCVPFHLKKRVEIYFVILQLLVEYERFD